MKKMIAAMMLTLTVAAVSSRAQELTASGAAPLVQKARVQRKTPPQMVSAEQWLDGLPDESLFRQVESKLKASCDKAASAYGRKGRLFGATVREFALRRQAIAYQLCSISGEKSDEREYRLSDYLVLSVGISPARDLVQCRQALGAGAEVALEKTETVFSGTSKSWCAAPAQPGICFKAVDS